MSRHESAVDRQLGNLAALAEPVRRLLYRYVAGRREGVSREQAASGVGVAHHVAKFHLDRLEADGLLETEYRRPAGRSGPGAGRPAKIYRRSDREIALSLPERRYDLAAEVMADAIAASESDGLPITDALRSAATVTGRRIGTEARAVVGSDITAAEVLCEALDQHGYAPRRDEQRITLDNCPFHALAAEHTALVCGMNLDLVNGAIDELRPHELCAQLDPSAERCCVTITDRASDASA
ncbi:MAG TPA: helix-turn-helix domain-containing protein [Jatrophihabitantaceae bacterium]|jgi:predicted ArsR family transcriptional regulator